MTTVHRTNSIGQPEGSPRPVVTRAIATLAILGLIFNVCTIFIGFHHSLYDRHGFRQTQTAFNVESLLHGAGFLHYETPVLGPPWALPFEFPVYQEAVAGVVRLLGTPMEGTGRAVSILFFYLCFFPLISILRQLRFSAVQILPVLTIFAMGPLYIFFSRVFMIESTALFLSLMYVEQMFRLTLGARPWLFRHMFGAAMFGILGGMVKVTTFAPYYVLGVALVVWQAWKLYQSGAIRLPRLGAAAIFSGLLPVAFTALWTKFADSVKAQNPFGVALTSKGLENFNFGTIAQRLQPRWYHLLENRLHLQIGYTVAGVLIAGVYAGMIIAGQHVRPFQRWTRIAAVCVLLWAGTTMLFFNLHAVHDYYGYATAVLLLVGIGALLAPMLELQGRKAWVGVVLLAVEMTACAASYFREYYPIQAHNFPGRAAAAMVIDETTNAQSVIIVTGLDWSSEFPYQSQRHAIMDQGRGFAGRPWDLSAVRQAVENEGSSRISAVVACDVGRSSDRLMAILQIVGMSNPTELHGDDCDIYERPGSL
jgi:hypothetical protein